MRARRKNSPRVSSRLWSGMCPENPFSKTGFEFTRDRLQHFSTDTYACAECGHRYHPMVHSQPFLVQAGAIVIGAGLFAVFCYGGPTWLYPFIPIVIGGSMFWYRARDRRVFAPKGVAKLRYGDIILKCPECGSTNSERAAA